MALVDHLKASWLIDGRFQVKLTNVSLTVRGNNQPVETLEGLAGKTPGSRQIQITGTWAIEPGGPEFDVFQAVFDGSIHEVQIPYGTKSIVGKGWWDEGGLSGSVNSNTEFTGTFFGSFDAPK